MTTFLRSFPSREDAEDFATRYRDAVKSLAHSTVRYSVRVARLPGHKWAVYVRAKEKG